MIKKEEKNQLIDKAENILIKYNFTGELEKDLRSIKDEKTKQAYLIETLLYKYEHDDTKNKLEILKNLKKELQKLGKIEARSAESEKSIQEIYEDVLAEAAEKFTERKCIRNGNEIVIKAFPCGEYFDGEKYVQVTAKAIHLNDESLYEVIPSEGVWSVATRFADLKLVSLGLFDDPRDAFGYIEYCDL